MNEGSIVNLCFLDSSKPFDVVNHRIICAKLAALVTWIINFLADRTVQACIGIALYNKAMAPNGVPQVSVIVPLLFIVMINDLLDKLRFF